MTVYFEAKNNDYKVTINDTDKMLCLSRCGPINYIAEKVRDSGGLTWYGNKPNADRRVGFIAILTITLREGELLVALKPPDDDRFICFTNQQSDSEIDVIIMTTSDITAMNEFLTKLYVYVFGENRAATNNAGIQIFDADGQLVFKSTDMLLNIKDIWVKTFNNLMGGWTNSFQNKFEIVSDARNLAVICCSTPASWTRGPANSIPPQVSVYGYQNSANSLCAKIMTMYWFVGNYMYYNGLSENGNVILVDVSNMPQIYLSS